MLNFLAIMPVNLSIILLSIPILSPIMLTNFTDYSQMISGQRWKKVVESGEANWLAKNISMVKSCTLKVRWGCSPIAPPCVCMFCDNILIIANHRLIGCLTTGPRIHKFIVTSQGYWTQVGLHSHLQNTR